MWWHALDALSELTCEPSTLVFKVSTESQPCIPKRKTSTSSWTPTTVRESSYYCLTPCKLLFFISCWRASGSVTHVLSPPYLRWPGEPGRVGGKDEVDKPGAGIATHTRRSESTLCTMHAMQLELGLDSTTSGKRCKTAQSSMHSLSHFQLHFLLNHVCSCQINQMAKIFC